MPLCSLVFQLVGCVSPLRSLICLFQKKIYAPYPSLSCSYNSFFIFLIISTFKHSSGISASIPGCLKLCSIILILFLTIIFQISLLAHTLSGISSFFTFYAHLIFNILLQRHTSKTCIFFLSSIFTILQSIPHIHITLYTDIRFNKFQFHFQIHVNLKRTSF